MRSALPARGKLAAAIAVLACALGPSSAAIAAQSTSPSAGSAGAAGQSAQMSGTIIAIHGEDFTVQAPGRRLPVVNALIAAANEVTAGDYPYVYGGGHPEAGIPNIGLPGPGYNGRRIGFDCSGSVAAVLAGGGLWQPGSGVPADNGIIAELLSEHLIAPGPGHGPTEVTLYDDPGVHIFMRIDGRYFGTSDGYAENASQRRGGAGWLNDGAPDTTRRIYKRYHVLIWLLTRPTTYSPTLTFKAGPGVGRLSVGESVHVSYIQPAAGSMTARSVRAAG